MRVLALDTTTAHGSVAVLDEAGVVGEVRQTAEEGHSRWLLPAIESLLGARGWGLADLGGFAVTIGPGSFTGLRVGIATVQGLALGAGRPCVGRSTLDVLASLVPEVTGPLVALVDAWRDEVYARPYEAGEPRGEPFSCPVEGLASRVAATSTFVGEGARRYAERLRRALPRGRIVETDPFLAVPLGRLALRALREGGGRGPEELAPLYVRGADIRPGPPRGPAGAPDRKRP
jgi:tRNA threonylcarbamoyladenosine biosynthesis protein TsaB